MTMFCIFAVFMCLVLVTKVPREDRLMLLVPFLYLAAPFLLMIIVIDLNRQWCCISFWKFVTFRNNVTQSLCINKIWTFAYFYFAYYIVYTSRSYHIMCIRDLSRSCYQGNKISDHNLHSINDKKIFFFFNFFIYKIFVNLY